MTHMTTIRMQHALVNILRRNAQSIADMDMQAINYGGDATPVNFLSAVRAEVGQTMSARELIEHDDCDAILTDAVRAACAALGISSAGLHVRATHSGRSIVSY
jgi:hypothetical protein